jgi:GH25 family lysozyme M1 (1,4-beta-N-acetylmuramidase)
MAYTVVDLSSFNTVDDYSSAAGAIDGVIIRVGYRGYGSAGTLAQDSLFTTHYNGFKDTSVKIGYYFFTQATTEAEGIAEADYVYNLIKNQRCDFPVYIDSEYGNSDHTGRADSLNKATRTTCVKAFCDRIIELGYRAGVYASQSWFASNLDFSELTSYSIWVAKYSTEVPTTSQYDGWQYTSTGTLAGRTGNTDFSYFYNDVAGWESTDPIDISTATVTLNHTSYTYSGSKNKPTPTVVIDSTTLSSSTDYNVSYSNNTNVGTGKVTITGKGNYTGTKTVNFTITAKSISDLTASLSPTSSTYTGSAIQPQETVTFNSTELVLNTDYTVAYSDNINVGTGKVTITGKGNYSGTKELSFTINPRSISTATLSCGTADSTGCYNLDNLTVTLDGKTLASSNYDISTTNTTTEKYVQTRVTVSGKGNYTGSCIGTYNTEKIYKDISQEQISVTGTYTYSGLAITPTLNTTLKKDTDYTISYSDNINAGKTAQVILTGIGDYNGTKTINFEILPKSIENANISINITSGKYDLSSIVVSLDSKTLTSNDYNINTEEVVEFGFNTLKIIATGKNNYTGQAEESVYINRAYIDINSVNINIDRSIDYIYTGSAIIPKIVTNLNENVDYVISCSNNVDVTNSAIVLITGKGDYNGTKEISFEIISRDINETKISCGNPDQDNCYDINNISITYNDKPLAGSDYRVSISKTVSKYPYIITTVLIEGINNFSNSISIDYNTKKLSVDTGDDPVDVPQIYKGKSVELRSADIYSRFCSNKSVCKKTGTYFIYDLNIKNNRIRVTNSIDGLTIPGRITGWVSLDNILDNKDDIKLGDKVIVSGNINVYADGSGNIIYKNSEVMYVVDKLSSDDFEYNYGVATTKNKTRQGWAKLEMLKLYNEES